MNTPPPKLTKKLFLTIPSGRWIASNVMNDDATPVYVGEVSGEAGRVGQWSEIAASGAAQRNCWVFDTKADYVRWWGGIVKTLPEHVKAGAPLSGPRPPKGD